MDENEKTIEQFYRFVGCTETQMTVQALGSAVQNGVILIALVRRLDSANLWVQFPLVDANFHGAFVFVGFCKSNGVDGALVPDAFNLVAGRDTERLVCCLRSAFQLTWSTDRHSGPKADDSEDCSCLLCRWKCAIRVLCPTSHAWSARRLPNSVRRLVEEGMPRAVREHVWLILSGGLNLLRTRKSQYLSYFPKALESSFLSLIDLDISRTYSEDATWREQGYDVVTRRLLAAYSVRNSSVGYCQGLSYIAGLLVTVMNEEAAFAVLCAILEDGLIPPDYYTSLTGAVVDRKVLEELVENFLPNLVDLLQENLADYTFMTIPWHMCLFSTTLDRTCSIRLWDFFFTNGPCVLFRTSLGILRELESAIQLGRLSINEVRTTLRKIEERTIPSDIALYCNSFRECTNELVEELRTKLRSSTADARKEVGMTVRVNSCVADNAHFGAPITELRSPSRKQQSRDARRSVMDGLGDFLGQ